MIIIYVPKSPHPYPKDVELFPELDLHSSKEEGNKSKMNKQINQNSTDFMACHTFQIKF